MQMESVWRHVVFRSSFLYSAYILCLSRKRRDITKMHRSSGAVSVTHVRFGRHTVVKMPSSKLHENSYSGF